MRDAYGVILAPVLTEKSTGAMEDEHVYTFLVQPDATKLEIREAVEQLWDVRVEGVRTMRYAGKVKNAFLGQMARNRFPGRQRAFKKALVRLTEGDHIDFYEVG